MDRTTKTAIKNMVLDLRQLLEDDVEVVLKRYGIFTDRDWLPIDEVPRADARIRAERERMAAVIINEQARGISRGEATGWYVREVAFTYLNRLVGLKCLEVRDLIDEVITTRPEYGNRSRFHRDFRHDNRELAAQPNDALPEAFEAACRIVNEEMIGVLFDPDSENSVVAPRFPALREAISQINDLPEEVWAEDEIIGWIYQFYNTEEKKQIRDRGRPELPIEVAVINQFFTPRWIVKFLVDNTLGRLWLEMHPDSRRVREKCDYLVPEPVGKQEGNGADGDFRLDPASPVNNPEAEPRRQRKPVTEIRLIDPACGTMHFGYYAFEVFQEIYRDARERGWQIGAHPDTPPPSDAEVPALILAHNLYGVDIDLRAVQLAALSLYMKARVAEREIDPDYRAPSYRVNLVSADARLADGELRERFVEEYEDDPQLQKAWRELFKEMEDIAQVGSLLRVEERLKQLLEEYQPQSIDKEQLRPGGQRELLLDDTPRQMTLADAPGGEGWTPRRTLAQMLNHLRQFAGDALQEADVNAQLFASEATKTLGLLDILLQDYEVAVMNPPYNYRKQMLPAAADYLDQSYERTKANLFSAFIERGLTLVGGFPGGYLGALTPRTFLYQSSYRHLRGEVLANEAQLVTLAEYGLGILDDATERPASFVLRTPRPHVAALSAFFDLREERGDRQLHLHSSINALWNNSLSDITFLNLSDFFNQIPDYVIMYRIFPRALEIFRSFPPLDCDQLTGQEREQRPSTKIADVKIGLQTSNDARFVRQVWEVYTNLAMWKPFAKGGAYSPYYDDIDLVVKWGEEGEHLRELARSRGPGRPILRNEQFYLEPGLTMPKVSERGMSVRFLPAGVLFAQVALCIFPSSDWDRSFLCALLNSRCLEYCMRVMTPARDRIPGNVGRLPVKSDISDEFSHSIGRIAVRSCTLKAAWNTGSEISTRFNSPWLLQLAQQKDAFEDGLGNAVNLLGNWELPPSANLAALLKHARTVEERADNRLQTLQAEIDEAVYDLYRISQVDRALIERELGERAPELVWPQMEGKSRKEKNREHVRRLLSYFVLESIKADADGILPVFPGTGEPTALERLRERLAAEFGEEAAFKLEDDAGKVMGRSVENWLDGQFIKWHTSLYNKRPIIWHIASPKNNFGVFVYIHKLDRDTLRKVRNVYLRTAKEGAQSRLHRAREEDDQKTVSDEEDLLDELQQLDERLAAVINNEVGYKPPKWAEGPYRGGVYDPVIDDGVKVNLMPLQKGEVLRYKRMI